MKNYSFEYFLNAVHYSLWLIDMKFGDFMGKIVDKLLSPIPKYLFTEKYRKKCYERQSKEQKNIDKLFYDKETGYHVCSANHWFGYLYSGYSIFFSFFLVGIASKRYEHLSSFIVILLFAVPIGLCYIPAYRSVFSNDRYLKYYKQFEKKDKRWHRKWKWITIVFCVGSYVTAIAGIFVMSAVGRSFLRWTATI